MKLYFYILEDDGIKCHESSANEAALTYCNFDRPSGFYRLRIGKSEIGEIIGENAVVLTEKNDMMAKGILLRYLSRKIADKEMQIECMKKQLEIVERWEIENGQTWSGVGQFSGNDR